MSKKSILYFFTLFISLYLGFLTLAFIFKATGFDKYEDTAIRYYKGDNTLAYLLKRNKNYLASTDGKVKAANWIETGVWLFQTAQAAKGYYDNAKTADSPGFAGGMTTATTDFACSPLIGGNCTPCKDQVKGLSGSLNFSSVNSESCSMSNGFFNKFSSQVSNSNSTNLTAMQGGGLYALTNNLIGQTMVEYDDITSINLYARETTKEIPFIGQSAYAADDNFYDSMIWGTVKITALSKNFFKIWQLTRNLAYFLIIIPTVVLGFAIMFRMQIGPQTQVTLLQALPKLLIVMILITFSYPLSSLIIQMGKPITTVVVGILQVAVSAAPETNPNAGISFPNIISGIVLLLFGASFLVGGGILGIALLVILLILFLIAIVRYGIGIFMTVFKIAFLVAFSPLILLVAAFPGREGIIKQYFVNLIAYVLGLSAIAGILMAAYVCIYFAAASSNLLAYLGFMIAGFMLLWKSTQAPKIMAQMLGVKPILGEIEGGDPKRR